MLIEKDRIQWYAAESVDYFLHRYNITATKELTVKSSNLVVRKVIYFGQRFIKTWEFYRRNRIIRMDWVIP